MPLAAYDPCPCGSGKKLKFCCQSIADEMDRAMRLMEGNQPRVALQQLESLSRKHPSNPWIGTSQALILIELNEPLAARDVLKKMLVDHPDHEFGIVLMAAAMLQGEGLDAAKKAIHKAFQRSARKYPPMVSGLASAMATLMAQRQKPMAAREHLALALRLCPEERRQELFVQLLEFDGDPALPYPLRGSHGLPAVGGNEEQQKEIRKAQKYAAVGCWSTAADLFFALTKVMADSAELWHSVGLCRAWDGEELQAAEALHRAAQLYGDFPTAVECESLAQVLERANSTDVIEICTYEGQVGSIGRLLTILDQQPRLQRFDLPPAEPGTTSPVAAYQILDRPKWADGDYSQLNMDTIPLYQGHIAIYDAVPESQEPASLYLTGDRGADLEQARSLLESCSEGQVEWRTDRSQPTVSGNVPTESQPFRWRWSLTNKTPLSVNRRLKQQQWQKILDETWPNTPQKCLGGLTPVAAAADPQHKLALQAAIFALDAYCQQRNYLLDIDAALARFGLEPLAPLPVDESTQINMLSTMQMQRLPIDQLSVTQLAAFVNRALLTRHEGMLYRVLNVALSRPECREVIDLPRCLQVMVEICSVHQRRDEAFRWIEVARSIVPEGRSAFEYQSNWDFTELALRMEFPDDPALKGLLERFVTYYEPKVPQMRAYIESMCEQNNIPSPWDSRTIVTASSMPASSGSGLWNPDAPATPAGSSKLWLPGQ